MLGEFPDLEESEDFEGFEDFDDFAARELIFCEIVDLLDLESLFNFPGLVRDFETVDFQVSDSSALNVELICIETVFLGSMKSQSGNTGRGIECSFLSRFRVMDRALYLDLCGAGIIDSFCESMDSVDEGGIPLSLFSPSLFNPSLFNPSLFNPSLFKASLFKPSRVKPSSTPLKSVKQDIPTEFEESIKLTNGKFDSKCEFVLFGCRNSV